MNKLISFLAILDWYTPSSVSRTKIIDDYGCRHSESFFRNSRNGFLIAIGAFVLMVCYLVKTIMYGDPIQGFPTLIIVVLFLGGMQLMAIGVLGEYLGRIFNESKHRPVYLVKEYKGGEKHTSKNR